MSNETENLPLELVFTFLSGSCECEDECIQTNKVVLQPGALGAIYHIPRPLKITAQFQCPVTPVTLPQTAQFESSYNAWDCLPCTAAVDVMEEREEKKRREEGF